MQITMSLSILEVPLPSKDVPQPSAEVHLPSAEGSQLADQLLGVKV